ncbi:MAG: urea ABC transporter permease subunit UrtB [Proteobacteria bacterium]|nr:urea ABC transporter permease subunit UrtB [Pseudomonadota bacterium]
MMRNYRNYFSRPASALLLLLAMAAPLQASPSEAVSFEVAAAGLASSSYSDRMEAINALGALGDPRASGLLGSMLESRLYRRVSDDRLVDARREGSVYLLSDPSTGEPLGEAGSRDIRKIMVNNSLRGAIRAVLSRMDLFSEDLERRRTAVEAATGYPSSEMADSLAQALANEDDTDLKAAMEIALATSRLLSTDAAMRLAGLETLSKTTSSEVRTMVSRLTETDADGEFYEPDPRVRGVAASIMADMEARMRMLENVGKLYQGLSLGSVLLIAAVGLAITFGVMGVINMAHGEMIMLGAYSTFVVQELFRDYLPADLFHLYLPVAVPVAFLVTGLVGVALERGIIRFLYGRPLETLLATWGVSLVLQQAVRTVFGAPNRAVENPFWMTGGFELAGVVTLTWNRLVVIAFALAVLAALGLLLRYTALGLQMRAVTQNREMASAMGIKTGRVDYLTFGLGSAIAGVAGVALSQVGNVSPNLGQSYIIDSFMVVVFGGVGSLWGTLTGAMSLGVINKFLEPVAGAVLGKILVLVFIIIFIQRRPRGLFAMSGRAAED